jgi:ferrous iron transport protein A
MDLSEIGCGKWVRVTRFMGGGGLTIKLHCLGIMPGDIARVIRMAPFGGPVLIEIGGREIALGRGIAKKIEVEESTPP